MRLSIIIIFLFYAMLASRAARVNKRLGRVMKPGEGKDQDGPKRKMPATGIGMGSSPTRLASAKQKREQQLAEDEVYLEPGEMLRIENEIEKESAKRDTRPLATMLYTSAIGKHTI